MPEAMADPLRQAFTDVKVSLYSNKLSRTRDFLRSTSDRPEENIISPAQRPKSSLGTNRPIHGRFHSASDVFFNSPIDPDAPNPWEVADVANNKEIKSSDSLKSRSMVHLDRARSAHSRSVMGNKDKNTAVVNSRHVHDKSSNPVKPVIKENRFKSASTTSILSESTLCAPSKQYTSSGSRPNTAAAVGGSRYKQSIKERLLLNQSVLENNSKGAKRPKTTNGKGRKGRRHSDIGTVTGPTSVWSKFFDETLEVKETTSRNNGSTIKKEHIDPDLDVTRSSSRLDPNSHQHTYRSNRNRSKSPAFIPSHISHRSRSLSSRRLDASVLPPSGRLNNKNSGSQDNVLDSARSSSRVNSGHSRVRGRRSSVPHVKWKQQNPNVGSIPVEGMNGESLPPIHSNRSESALSKRSSRESLGSATGDIPRGTVFKYEKPFLITVDSPMQTGDSPNPIKRSHLSPASQKSESSGNSKGKTNGYLPTSATLETLFEQKNSNLGVYQLERDSNAVEESAIDSGYNSYNQAHAYKSMKFPTKERRGSLASSTVNGKLTPSKRTQSVSNMTNPSDASYNGRDDGFTTTTMTKQPNSKPAMHRIRSENVLSVPQSNERSTTPRNNKNQTLRSNNTKPNNKTFSRTVSQPQLLQQNDTELNARNIKKNSKSKGASGGSLINNSKNTTVEGDDGSDGEKNDRIVQWLIGVETAEPPPTPDIAEEEPRQTDTAIHVVYNGD